MHTTNNPNRNEDEDEVILSPEPRICPRCQQPYVGFPAISRVDNKTPICSECGREEAHNAVWLYENRPLLN